MYFLPWLILLPGLGNGAGLAVSTDEENLKTDRYS
jgi:hypothetical protein